MAKSILGAASIFLRLVWNGPFFAGRPAPPLSLGDVLMKVLETAWRVALIAGIAFILIIAGSMAKGSLEASERDRDRALVALSVRYDPQTCGPLLPLKIEIQNLHTSKEVTAVHFRLKGRVPGFSNNALGFAAQDLRSELIVGPKRRGVLCFQVPRYDDPSETYPQSDLEYSVEVSRAEFVKPSRRLSSRSGLPEATPKGPANDPLQVGEVANVIVQGPDCRNFSFPKEMTEAEMAAVMKRLYPSDQYAGIAVPPRCAEPEPWNDDPVVPQ